MEDNRLIDGPGIDTQAERDSINYRPTIEYTKPRINADYYVAPTTNSQVITQAFISPKANTTWENVIAVRDRINTLETTFSQTLKDSYAIVPDRFLDSAINAANRFGYQIQDRKIPFDLYKKVLQSSDSHEKIILQDIFENYQADVEGSLVAEVYPDIFEIQQDWNNTIEFVKNGLIAQITDKSAIVGDTLSPTVEQRENSLGNTYLQTKQLYDQYAGEMRQLYMVGGESNEFYDAKAKYTAVRQTLQDTERRLATKNEVASLIEAKTNQVSPLLTAITNYTDANPFKGNSFNLLYSLLAQYTSGQETEEGLRKIQALLKLSIDGKIENVDSIKMNVRTVSSNQNKQNVNTTLVKSIHLRNEVYGQVLNTVDSFVDPPNDFLFNLVTEHIVDSVGRADDLYTEQSSDYYKISSLDTELRRDKFIQLVDKDSARKFYVLIDRLVSYANQGAGWPSYSGLASWLQNFINHEGL